MIKNGGAVKTLILFLIILSSSSPVIAQSLNTQLTHFTGTYQLLSKHNAQKWKAVSCPARSVRVKLEAEEGGLAINFYTLENGVEEYYDPDLYSFRAINLKKSGGGFWDGSDRVVGSHECKLTKDGALVRIQKIKVYALGIAPNGKSSAVTRLHEKNNILTYQRTIDGELVVQCVYRK